MSANHDSPLVIFPNGYDERAEFETAAKGWLNQVVVETPDGARYPVSFIDPTRLQQDMEEYAKAGTPYFSEPGLIILSEVTTEAIQAAVKALWTQGFFDALKPLASAACSQAKSGAA